MTNEIKILGKSIPLQSHTFSIYELKFLKDNPRVYECTHGTPGFDEMPTEEQQEIIYAVLVKQPSVKNLIPEIKEHGGLMEPILVRGDTMEVIEGNSRLAAYRFLNKKQPDVKWETIPCYVVKKLTYEQQMAYLSQVHVKGKNPWSAYEKANVAYVMKSEKGLSYEQIAKLMNESMGTSRLRIRTIEMMKEERDNEQSHFSYYDVLIRNQDISQAMKSNRELREKILKDIKNVKDGDSENNDFTAQALRQQLPVVIKKPKILKKFIKEEIELEDAYQQAKQDNLTEKIKKADGLLKSVSSKDAVFRLGQKEFNDFKYSISRLKRTVNRINDIVEKYESQ